ncbi:hypothetical protein [Photorhabdus khanii]|uniref:hypothetical protein n=1 Tax=Photorhabdus khanii TaxID=1004150 RepID=UPI00128EB4D3|nr:hypothetical protein [Photorhabdus khanii]
MDIPDRVLRVILFAEYDHRDGQRLPGAPIPSGRQRKTGRSCCEQKTDEPSCFIPRVQI